MNDNCYKLMFKSYDPAKPPYGWYCAVHGQSRSRVFIWFDSLKSLLDDCSWHLKWRVGIIICISFEDYHLALSSSHLRVPSQSAIFDYKWQGRGITIFDVDRGVISLSQSMEKATNLNDAGNAIEVGSKGALVFLTDPLSMIAALEQRRRDESLEIT